MAPQVSSPLSRRRFRFGAVCLALAALPVLLAATKHPVKKPSYDPSYPEVELFDALERGVVESTVIPKSPLQGNLFVTNRSGAPLTVRIPQVVAAVHVLRQAGNPFGGPASGATANQQNGSAQTVGGSPQSGQNGNNSNLPGGTFFSIASDQTVQIPLKTVCLSHGKPDPRANMTYRLVPITDVTTDRVLPEVLKSYVKGDVDPQTAQAAAWHLVNDMSWRALKDKKVAQLGGIGPKPYFAERELKSAEVLVSRLKAEIKAASPPDEAPKKL